MISIIVYFLNTKKYLIQPWFQFFSRLWKVMILIYISSKLRQCQLLVSSMQGTSFQRHYCTLQRVLQFFLFSSMSSSPSFFRKPRSRWFKHNQTSSEAQDIGTCTPSHSSWRGVNGKDEQGPCKDKWKIYDNEWVLFAGWINCDQLQMDKSMRIMVSSRPVVSKTIKKPFLNQIPSVFHSHDYSITTMLS